MNTKRTTIQPLIDTTPIIPPELDRFIQYINAHGDERAKQELANRLVRYFALATRPIYRRENW